MNPYTYNTIVNVCTVVAIVSAMLFDEAMGFRRTLVGGAAIVSFIVLFVTVIYGNHLYEKRRNRA